MLDKNIEKEKRKNRKTWEGYYERKTATKKEKMRRDERRKNKYNYHDDEE